MTREYSRPRVADPGVRLHLNENTAGASPRVVEALRQLDRRTAGTYPDYDAAYAAVSRSLGVGRESIVLTNGLDEGILAVAAAALRNGSSDPAEAIGVAPAFDMYEICTRALGGTFVSIRLEGDFALPFEAITRAVTAATRIVFLSNPHNPSGVAVSCARLRTLARALAPVAVFVDEAYAEFSGESLIDQASLELDTNLIVGRTFSKAYGLAGLRVGAVVAAPATLNRIRAVVPPYSVNAWAAAALPYAVADKEYRDWYVAQAADSRALLTDACRRFGLRTWPSAANFQLIEFGRHAPRIVADLARLGIAVRDRSDDPCCTGCVRVTAGLVHDTRLFVTALEEILCDARP